MAYLDELRNTLLNRKKPEQATLPEQSKEGSYGLQAASGLVRGNEREAPMQSPTSDRAPNNVPSNVFAGLKNAISGIGGSNSSAPKTGMTAPTWPGTPAPMGPGELPIGLPNEGAKVPPRWQRFETAQKMIDGYQNNWSPNPILTRILEGGR